MAKLGDVLVAFGSLFIVGVVGVLAWWITEVSTPLFEELGLDPAGWGPGIFFLALILLQAGILAWLVVRLEDRGQKNSHELSDGSEATRPEVRPADRLAIGAGEEEEGISSFRNPPKRMRGPLSRSRVVLAIGLILLGATLLFPPWEFTFTAPGMATVTRPAGYSVVISPPSLESEGGFGNRRTSGVRIDWSRLLIEMGVVVVLGGVGFLVLDRPRTDG